MRLVVFIFIILIFGIVAHAGIFVAAAVAYYCFGFDIKEALSIGVMVVSRML